MLVSVLFGSFGDFLGPRILQSLLPRGLEGAEDLGLDSL